VLVFERHHDHGHDSRGLLQAVEAFIYFANIRADYKWAFINKTLVYAYNKVSR
jgi:hypothetical protein